MEGAVAKELQILRLNRSDLFGAQAILERNGQDGRISNADAAALALLNLASYAINEIYDQRARIHAEERRSIPNASALVQVMARQVAD